MSGAFETAKRVLEADEAVLYGIFGVIAGTGYFPPRDFLNEFLMVGSDPCDQDGRMSRWQPFTLSPGEYAEVKAWWAAGHLGAVVSDLGVGCWNDWVQVILNPKDWGFPDTLPRPAEPIPAGMAMQIDRCPDPAAAARQAAAFVAATARSVVATRGRCVVAFSGGSTPAQMLRDLAQEQVPWANIHVVQVDERIAPAGSADRNWTQLRDNLLTHTPTRPEQVNAMPVEADDLETAARQYAETLREIAGTPPVLDLVHLGLGPDGHTASLVPGDPVLEVMDVDVALTGVYKGRRRMTLTYPILNRAQRILWLVTGSDKAGMLARLLVGDPSIPAGRIRQDQAIVIADQAAASA
jgi:6-phosphogluconolactonase